MKLKQLRCVYEIARNALNVSQAATHLHTSQPNVSKQIKLLEDELDIEIFARNGKHITNITPVGKAIITLAAEILQREKNIKQLAQAQRDLEYNTINITASEAITNTLLLGPLKAVAAEFPKLKLNITTQRRDIVQELHDGTTDFYLGTKDNNFPDDIICLPIARYQFKVIVTTNHLLASKENPTLQEIAAYPLVSYIRGTVRFKNLLQLFIKNKIATNFVFGASNAAMLKDFVRNGLGVGIIESIALGVQEPGIIAFETTPCWQLQTINLCFAKDTKLQRFHILLIVKLFPYLTPETLNKCINMSLQQQAELFNGLVLPIY